MIIKANTFTRIDLWAALGVFIMQLLLTLTFYPMTAKKVNFFYEYGNIAEAIVTGKGYSNVFRAESGPTAWMVPGFVYVIVAIYELFGVKTTMSLWASILFEHALLALALYLLLQLLNMSVYRSYRYLMVFLFTAAILMFQASLLKSLFDQQLMILLAVLTLYGLVVYFQKGKRGWLFFLALTLPLFNPALTLAFAVILFAVSFLKLIPLGLPWSRHFYTHPAVKRTCGTLGAVVVGFVISTGLWTYRNYQAFGRFIPSKSNLWYEFYQSNVLDNDGVLSPSTMLLYHPSTNLEEQQRFVELGEYQYVAQYKHKAKAFLTEHPAQLYRKVGNRLIWAFLWSKPSVVDITTYNPPLVGFTPADSLKLLRARLIHQNATSVSSNRWLGFNMTASEFVAALKPLHLDREKALIEDWKHSKQYLQGLDTRPRGLLKGTMLSLVPTLCILLGLLVRNLRRDLIFITAAGLCLVYMLPYTLIAYYFRYQVVLMGIQAVLVFYVAVYLYRGLQAALSTQQSVRLPKIWKADKL
jgi:hypothetical protein